MLQFFLGDEHITMKKRIINGFINLYLIANLILSPILPASTVYAGEEEETQNLEWESVTEYTYEGQQYFDPLDCTPLTGNQDNDPIIVGALPDSEYTHYYANNDEERRSMRLEYESVVAHILAGINPSWSDAEKLLYLHDYICLNSEYAYNDDHEPDRRYVSAYANLVQHKSVCDGYARAFYDLANRAGINTFQISSGELDHAWNMVEIGGKHYYVDCTWDDYEFEDDSVLYRNFLKSEDAFCATGHLSEHIYIDSYWNVGVSDIEDIKGKYNDKEYDDVPWSDPQQWKIRLIPRPDGCYYVSETINDQTGGVYRCSSDLKQSTLLKPLNYIWTSITVGDTLFFSYDDKALYRYVYETNELIQADHVTHVNDQGMFEDFSVDEENKLLLFKEHYINNQGQSIDEERSIDISDYLDDFRISFDKQYQVFYRIGDSIKLNATVSEVGTSIDSWVSSNTSVATVDSNGNIRAVGYGMAYIKAFSGTHQEWFPVFVPRLKADEEEINIDRKRDGKDIIVKVSLCPEDFFYSSRLVWTSSDSEVVKVFESTAINAGYSWSDDEGNNYSIWGRYENALQIGKTGSAEITISTPDGKLSTSFRVNVTAPLERVDIDLWRFKRWDQTEDPEFIELEEGYSRSLNYYITPYDASGNTTATWSSSDESVATVDADGKVTGIKPGITTISIKVQDKSDSIELHVLKHEDYWGGSNYSEDWEDDLGGSEDNEGGDQNRDQNTDQNKSEEHVTMLRLYNPNTGEHFYTANEREKRALEKAGWTYEGKAWEAPKWSNTPVYRLYNENAGDHHYTPSKRERDNLIKQGWKDEGIGWYSDDNKSTPLYRLYNPNATTGSHHYTTSARERDKLVQQGWQDENIGWYGLPESK